MKFFVEFDIFGIPYQFLRNGNIKYKTKTGFCLTIFYMMIIISLFLGFGIDLYTRKNPKVSFNSLIKSHEEKNLTNNNFLFAYRIEDHNGIEIRDDSIIKLQLILYNYKLINGDWNIVKSDLNVPKTRCLDIPNIDKHEKYYNISLKNWFCINFENITLGGFWNGEFVNYLLIHTEQCKNSTANNYTCQSQEKIINSFKSNFSSNYYFSYLYMEAIPTLDDFNYPIKSTLINRYEMLDTKISKKHIHTFKETAVNDDRGWIFTDIGLQSIYCSDNILFDFNFKDQTKESIVFAYYMYFGKRYEVYNRTYLKIQEVIASIGGFSKFFHIMVSVLFGYISNIMKNFDLMETKFIEYSNTIPNQTEKLLMKDNKIQIVNKNIIDLKFTKYKNMSRIKNELDLTFIIKQKLFCKKSPSLSKENKMRLIEYELIKKYNNHKFDAITYLKLFKDFNIIKKILLDDTQLKALDIIHNNYIIDEPVNAELFLPKFQEYIRNSNNISEINKRLFNLF